MCLGIHVVAPAADAALLDRAAAAARGAGLQAEVRRGVLAVSEDGGCACSLLADHADWGAPTWALRPDVLEPLARTVEAIAAALGARPFTVEACWVGDPVRADVAVTARELADRVRANALGQQVRYHVAEHRRAP